jgi:hypothetical protein
VGLPEQFVAFDPAEGTLVVNEPADRAVLRRAVLEGGRLGLKGARVKLRGSAGRRPLRLSDVLGAVAAAKGRAEWEAPADDAAFETLREKFGLHPALRAARTRVERRLQEAQPRLAVALDNKVDGQWYRLSADVPAGYRVAGIQRDDGTPLLNSDPAPTRNRPTPTDPSGLPQLCEPLPLVVAHRERHEPHRVRF